MARQAAAYRRTKLHQGFGGFQDIACTVGQKDQVACWAEANATFGDARAVADPLPDRQTIEKFVGDDDCGKVRRNLRQVISPGGEARRQHRSLTFAQRRTAFHQPKLGGRQAVRCDA